MNSIEALNTLSFIDTIICRSFSFFDDMKCFIVSNEYGRFLPIVSQRSWKKAKFVFNGL